MWSKNLYLVQYHTEVVNTQEVDFKNFPAI